jgi:hypothetical protein
MLSRLRYVQQQANRNGRFMDDFFGRKCHGLLLQTKISRPPLRWTFALRLTRRLRTAIGAICFSALGWKISRKGVCSEA